MIVISSCKEIHAHCRFDINTIGIRLGRPDTKGVMEERRYNGRF